MAKNTDSSSGRRFMRLRRGFRRENDDASNARRRCVFVKAPGSRRDVKRLSQVLRKFDGLSISTASRKTCVIWNCVHHARKHLRNRQDPRDSAGVGANAKVCSQMIIAGLDDMKFSGELHRYTPARTYPSDSEARPVGCDERCREGPKNRAGANGAPDKALRVTCAERQRRRSAFRE